MQGTVSDRCKLKVCGPNLCTTIIRFRYPVSGNNGPEPEPDIRYIHNAVIKTMYDKQEQVQPLPAGPTASSLGQTERQEMFVHRSPRKREVVSNEQLDRCKRNPFKEGLTVFRHRAKPMRGSGQQDHRERYVRVTTTRNQQLVSFADLQALSSGL